MAEKEISFMGKGSGDIEWGKAVRFLYGSDQTAIVDLERGGFLKIRSEALTVLQEVLSSGLHSVINRLNDSERAGLLDLLNKLREKKYLVDQSDPCSKRIPESGLDHFLNTPKIAYYSVSDFCNLTCPFCYANSKNKSAPYRGDTARSLKIIDRLASLNVVNLILSGGEPFLREDLFEIVEFAKEKNFLVGITTNGTLISLQQASTLKNSGADYVQISIESHIEAEHDALRGEGTFRKCLEAVGFLRGEGYQQDQIYITATTTRKNIAALRQYSAFAEGLGATPGTSFFQPVGRGHCNKGSLACSPREMLDFILGRMKEKRENIDSLSPELPQEQVSDALVPRIVNSCGMGHRTLGIKEDGTVVPCHLFFSCGEYEVGNILDDRIADTLNTFARDLPTVDDVEECRNCNVRYFCGNGCWAHAYWARGNIGSRNPYCEFYKKYFSAILWNLGMEDAMARIYDQMQREIDHQESGPWPPSS